MKSIRWNTERGAKTAKQEVTTSFRSDFESTYDAATLIDALKRVSGQRGEVDGWGKTTAEFRGTFGGYAFAVYDYKGDPTLHIGGEKGLDVEALKPALTKAIDGVLAGESVDRYAMYTDAGNRRVAAMMKRCRTGLKNFAEIYDLHHDAIRSTNPEINDTAVREQIAVEMNQMLATFLEERGLLLR